jgi:hypothetical protein
MATRFRHLEPAEFDELGDFCATLLSSGNPWVGRRKESITVLDESMIRRQQSVDFSMDAIESLTQFKSLCDRVFGCDVRAAPLFILDKDPVSSMAFDLKDESGRSLSLMTSEENGEISAATLKALARKTLEAAHYTLSDELAAKLENLAKADTSGGRDWLDRLKSPLPGDPDLAEIDVLLEKPGEDGEMSWWLNTLALASIVLVTFEAGSNHRRVIKIAYEQPTVRQSAVRQPLRFFARLGWLSYQTQVESPLIRSGRYHLEVKAPPEIRLTRAALVDDKTNRRNRAPGFRSRAHLYIDDAHDSYGALAQFALRVSGRGVLGGALLAALLVLVSILACMRYSEGIVEGSTGVPALLLVLPGIIATYVARSDQHGLTTRLLAIPRWILLLFAGVAAYYAAGAIALVGPVESGLHGIHYVHAVEEHSDGLKGWLRYAAYASAFAVVVIGIGWVFTRETTHRVLRWVRRNWGRYVKSRFDIQVTLGMPTDVVWARLQREIARLHQVWRFRNASPSIVNKEEYIVHRDRGYVQAIHGVKVTEAPGGTTVNWMFWATGPRPLKPFIALLVVWERLMTRRRIETLREP